MLKEKLNFRKNQAFFNRSSTKLGKMKYTMRYILGSEEKTLESKEIDKFKEKFMEHITKNGLEILF